MKLHLSSSEFPWHQVLSQTNRRNDHKNTFLIAEGELHNLVNEASSIIHDVHLLLRGGEVDSTGFSLPMSKSAINAKFVKIKDILEELKESVATTRDLGKLDVVFAELKATLFKRRCTIEFNRKKCLQLEGSDTTSAHELQKDCKVLQNIEEDLR